MLGRPTLGLTKLGAGAQGQHRAVEGQVELGKRRFAGNRVDLQARTWIRLWQLKARLVSQGHEALDHQRITILVQRAYVIEQAIAKLATPAGALRDAGKERHQRRLQ
ncbi:hypothetical protein D9M69_549720 [compost metagenome]